MWGTPISNEIVLRGSKKDEEQEPNSGQTSQKQILQERMQIGRRTRIPGRLSWGSSPTSSFSSVEWVSDSGATQHICGDLKWFTAYEEFNNDKNIVLSNNVSIQVQGKGIVELEALIQ